MAKREWTIRADDFETEAQFRDAIANEFIGLENIGHRMGVGFVASPHRRQFEGEWVTIGWSFAAVNVPSVVERAATDAADQDDTGDELLATGDELDVEAEAEQVAAAAAAVEA